MNQRTDHPDQERELWRRYAAAAAGESARRPLPDLDPNELAAYIDGAATPEEAERIEARMAADPEFLDEVIALREAPPAAPAGAPLALLARARALVRRAAPAAAGAAVRSAWWGRLQWAAAAAALVLACVGGYTSGRDTFRVETEAEAIVAAEAGRELEELISEPAVGISPEADLQNGGGS